MSLESELAPMLSAIGRELIAATPETWASAELLLAVAKTSETTEGISHVISSPDGHRDLVTATHELMNASFDLLQACKAHGKPFRSLKFTVHSGVDGGWRFSSNWGY